MTEKETDRHRIVFRTKEGKRHLGYEVRYMEKQLLKFVKREIDWQQKNKRTVTTGLEILQDTLQQRLFGKKRHKDLRRWRLLMYLQKQEKKEKRKKT